MDINTLYVQTQGSFRNEAIVFLHAFPLTSDMWKEQMNLFSKTHYILAPDIPGFGKGILPNHSITFEYYVDSILSFLKESGIKKSIWCGLSMGGYLALRLYERAPELCCGLILANTKASADNDETKIKRWETIKNLHSHRLEFEKLQWKAMVSEESLKNEKLKACFNEIVGKSTEEGLSAGIVSLATRTDTAKMLSTIKVPTMIIAGDEDKIISLSDMEYLHDNIPGSEMTIIERAGHLSSMERPEEFNKLIAEFITSLHVSQLQTNLMN